MLRSYLRGSKYNLETAKKKFEGYFLAKHAHPELYKGRDPSGADLKQVFDAV